MSARDVSPWTLQLKKLLSNEVDLILRLCADVTQLHETLQGHLGHLVADKRSPRQASDRGSARCVAFAHNLRTSFVLAPSVTFRRILGGAPMADCLFKWCWSTPEVL